MNNKPYSILIRGIGPVGGERSDIDADQLVRAFIKQLEAGGSKIEHGSLQCGGEVIHLAGKKEGHPAETGGAVDLGPLTELVEGLHGKVDMLLVEAREDLPVTPRPPKKKRGGAASETLTPTGDQTGTGADTAQQQAPKDKDMDANGNTAETPPTTPAPAEPTAPDTGTEATGPETPASEPEAPATEG